MTQLIHSIKLNGILYFQHKATIKKKIKKKIKAFFLIPAKFVFLLEQHSTSRSQPSRLRFGENKSVNVKHTSKLMFTPGLCQLAPVDLPFSFCFLFEHPPARLQKLTNLNDYVSDYKDWGSKRTWQNPDRKLISGFEKQRAIKFLIGKAPIGSELWQDMKNRHQISLALSKRLKTEVIDP